MNDALRALGIEDGKSGNRNRSSASSQSKTPSSTSQSSGSTKIKDDNGGEYVSIKDIVTAALKQKKNNSVDDIMKFAKDKHGMELNKGSLSSTLSKMKSSGEIESDSDKGTYSRAA